MEVLLLCINVRKCVRQCEIMLLLMCLLWGGGSVTLLVTVQPCYTHIGDFLETGLTNAQVHPLPVHTAPQRLVRGGVIKSFKKIHLPLLFAVLFFLLSCVALYQQCC